MKIKFSTIFVFLLSFAVGQSQFTFDVVEVKNHNDSNNNYYVLNNEIIEEGWDTLAQPNFWKKVMRLSPDSCVVNVAATREILFYTSFLDWQKQTEDKKDSVRKEIRQNYGLDSTERIYVTSGKSHFYQFEKVIPSLSKGIEIFENQEVNPWYAQSILLIESPGKSRYSNAGAYGPFQLMKSVARTYGLKVNRKVDERKDFDKSAVGASKLLKISCIPNAKRILNKHKISFSEDDLWFKLFVLHIYHAGAGNVGALIDNMKPETGGISLIQAMWQNEYGGFKNASQNYSQVALASNIILEELIYSNCESVYPCKFEITLNEIENIDELQNR